MQGKAVVITGANSGIGFITARELARMGARVLMVCRDGRRGARARAQVADAATGLAPELLLADVSSQAAVRALAQDLRRRVAAIDVLINNAGGVFARRELTADGIEKTFATNHLGAFLLTNLIRDLMAPDGRIINVAAESYPSKLDFDNLQGEKSYGFLNAYFRSKLENIIFTFDLAERLGDTGVTVNCASPGPSRTAFGDTMTGLPSLFPRLAKPLFPRAEKGARTIIHLASSPEVAGVSGRFFLRGKPRKTKPVTRDAEVAARLWRISAALTGLSTEPVIAMPETSSRDVSTAPAVRETAVVSS
jgi:NAD(P)-dependent dehydrogenase (short-subunit alcohol dehydrogenase family)